MKAAALILMALALVGCGTDEGEQVNPKPFTAAAELNEVNPRAYLDLTTRVDGCEWKVDAVEAIITDKTFEAGGHTLPHRYDMKTGSVYSLQGGRVTRWAEVAADRSITIGIQCL